MDGSAMVRWIISSNLRFDGFTKTLPDVAFSGLLANRLEKYRTSAGWATEAGVVSRGLCDAAHSTVDIRRDDATTTVATSALFLSSP